MVCTRILMDIVSFPLKCFITFIHLCLSNAVIYDASQKFINVRNNTELFNMKAVIQRPYHIPKKSFVRAHGLENVLQSLRDVDSCHEGFWEKGGWLSLRRLKCKKQMFEGVIAFSIRISHDAIFLKASNLTSWSF